MDFVLHVPMKKTAFILCAKFSPTCMVHSKFVHLKYQEDGQVFLLPSLVTYKGNVEVVFQ